MWFSWPQWNNWLRKEILTKSLKGCFSGVSHSSLMFMYLETQAGVFSYHIRVKSHLWRILIYMTHLLVKVSEEVDPERVLFVQFVSIGILYGLHGLSRKSIFQEDVPTRTEDLFCHYVQHYKDTIWGVIAHLWQDHTLWSCHQPLGRTL